MVVSSGEDFDEGINGYIVDPENISLLAELVLTLVRDHGLRLKMGVVGEQLFRKNYSLEAYNRNLKSALDFFDKLLLKSVLPVFMID